MRTNSLLFFILLLTLFNNSMYASNDSIHNLQEQQYAYAIRLLDGINTDINYAKARQILSSLSSLGYAPAMRTWGTIYNNGLGVGVNKERAYKAYYKAAKLGDARSMTNLGLMYQNGDYVKINYAKAMSWYEKGLSAGDKRNYYNIGYLYYKGYGTEQSYSTAFKYFLNGANEEKDGICKYMLGLCYIKGYGVEVNEELGRSWIEKAANNGYERAIDYILHYKPRAKKDSIGSKGINQHSMTNRVRSKADPLYQTDFSGEWEGTFYIMDWSKHIIEEEYPISLTIVKNVDQLEGKWELNGEDISFTAVIDDSGWKIKALSFKNLKGGVQQMHYCDFIHTQNGETETLQGNIQLERLKTKEPSLPNYFLLKKKEIASNDNTANIVSNFQVWPNPVWNNEFSVSLHIKSEQNVSFRIYNTNGQCVFSHNSYLHSGANSLILRAELTPGVYTIFADGQEFNYTSKIIKR